MKRFIALLVVACLLAGGGIAWWRWRSSPAWSLQRIQAAVREHDVETFERHVDVEGLLIRALPRLAEAMDTGRDSPFGGRELSRMLALAVQQPLVNAGREVVRGYVEKGSIDLAPLPKEIHERITGPGAWAPRSSFQLRDVARDGKAARVTLSWEIPAYDGSIPLGLLMRKAGSHWVVSEIEEPGRILASWASLQATYARRSLLGALCAIAPRLQTLSDGTWMHPLVRAGMIDQVLRTAYSLPQANREGQGDPTGIALVQLSSFLAKAKGFDAIEGMLAQWPADPHLREAFPSISLELVRAGRERALVERVLAAPSQDRREGAAQVVSALLAGHKGEQAIDVAERAGLSADGDDCVIGALAASGKTDEAMRQIDRRSDAGMRNALVTVVVGATAARGDLEQAIRLLDRLPEPLRAHASHLVVSARAAREGAAAGAVVAKRLGFKDLDWSLASAAGSLVDEGQDERALALLEAMSQPEERARQVSEVVLRLISVAPQRALKFFAILDVPRVDLWNRERLARFGMSTFSAGDLGRLTEGAESEAELAVLRAYGHGGATAAMTELSRIEDPLTRFNKVAMIVGFEAAAGRFQQAVDLARTLDSRFVHYGLSIREHALMPIAAAALAKGLPTSEQARLAESIMDVLAQR